MNEKTVWIINPYGTLPAESWAPYRSTMLAESLARHGFNVVQFISNFEHRSKSFRSQGFKKIRISDSYNIFIIPSSAYSSHISIDRIRYERRFAANLLNSIKGEKFPDYIILEEPALFYYNILLKPLIKKSGSKLILDVIDIWPELFAMAIPKRLRWMAPIILGPMFWWRKRLYKHANGIVAVSKDYLALAKTLTNRPIPFEVVYWSYSEPDLYRAESTRPDVVSLVARKQNDEVWIVYAGTLGENYDISSILTAARVLEQHMGTGRNFKFVIAGDGPLKASVEEASSDKLTFLGRLDPADLHFLYQHCDIALSTYKGDSTVAMPIKAFDYLQFGLPIVNSLKRDLGDLVEQHTIGINYDPEKPTSLYNALERLIIDSEFRKNCSKRATILASEFRAEVQYKKFVEVISKAQ